MMQTTFAWTSEGQYMNTIDEMITTPLHEDEDLPLSPRTLNSTSTPAPIPDATPAQAPRSSSSDVSDASPPSSPLSSPQPTYTEPLYTEINIPLPPLPKPKAHTAHSTRSKSHSISVFRPFHRRGSSGDSTSKSAERKSSDGGAEWPRIRKEVKSREVAAAMDLAGRSKHKRSGTVDALAVVPAVLVLSAELFTPEVEGKKRRGGKWEDGMI